MWIMKNTGNLPAVFIFVSSLSHYYLLNLGGIIIYRAEEIFPLHNDSKKGKFCRIYHQGNIRNSCQIRLKTRRIN